LPVELGVVGAGVEAYLLGDPVVEGLGDLVELEAAVDGEVGGCEAGGRVGEGAEDVGA